MLRDWQKRHPGRAESIFNALSNVVTTHLLDRRLQDFAAIRASGVSMPGGDIAFDDDPCVASSSGTVNIAPVD
jgi:tRNA 2-thiocytidine biosynthesis protein TtcA